MTMTRALAFVSAMLVGGVVSASGQSLGQVAEKEEARRKQTKKASRVYTNKDVKSASEVRPGAAAGATDTTTEPSTPGQKNGQAGAARQGAEAGQSGEAGQSAEQPEKPAADADKPPTDEEQRPTDEEQWRTRITEAREALERNQIFAQALQTRINSLWMDFTSRDDPAQRAVIEAERKKSIAQLDRVKAEIVTQTKAIADIEEEARRAGVPPGWLR